MANITGTAVDDFLTGTPLADIIDGLAGDDRMEGDAGSDHYRVGVGFGFDTILDSGGADDRLLVASLNDIVSAKQQGGDLVIAFEGGSSVKLENHVVASDRVEAIHDAGSSLALGASAIGGSRAEILAGTDDRDVLRAGGGSDFVFGAADDDFVFGGGGDDRLSGGDGNDFLIGGSGDDHMTGGPGRDIQLGGGGDDVFHFAAGDALDVIIGFDPTDTFAIDAQSFGLSPSADVDDVVKIGDAPTDGAGFHLTEYLLWFDADWSNPEGREVAAFFFGDRPALADFDLV